MPDLSIVIPTFNTAPMTLRCCRAVLDSMPESTEVIVVDDGSSDGTADLLVREVPAVRVARLQANRGFAPAANHGVALAEGRVILLLNSDAMAEPGALSAFLEAFDREPRLGVAGAQLLHDDGTPQWSGGRTPTLSWMLGVVSGAGPLLRFVRRSKRAELVREIDWVSGAAMAFRREVWAAAGPLSERYLFYCQDIDLCLHALEKGWTVRILPEARVRHALGRTIAGENALSYDPERLWSDLLTWGREHYGRRWSRFARWALLSAAALRIGTRTLRPPFGRDATTRAFRRGWRRLAQADS